MTTDKAMVTEFEAWASGRDLIRTSLYEAFDAGFSASLTLERGEAEPVAWEEPALTCPHIDNAIASGELSEAVKAELITIRDINSQLRYGTWFLKSQFSPFLSTLSKRGEAEETPAAITNMASEVERLRAALSVAWVRMRNARGAVESNQVVDKDVRGTLTRGIEEIDAVLSPPPPASRAAVSTPSPEGRL